MSKRGVYLFAFISFFIGFLVGQWNLKRDTKYTIEAEVPTDIVRTVAHLVVEDANYKLIYKDTETDVAYYQWQGSREMTTKDSIVYLYDNSEGVVLSTSINGFTAKFETATYKGLSGMAVLDEDRNQIGYISQVFDDGSVFCIWS